LEAIGAKLLELQRMKSSQTSRATTPTHTNNADLPIRSSDSDSTVLWPPASPGSPVSEVGAINIENEDQFAFQNPSPVALAKSEGENTKLVGDDNRWDIAEISWSEFGEEDSFMQYL
jgi:hypothetical protein